jgi:hypothetical protein
MVRALQGFMRATRTAIEDLASRIDNISRTLLETTIVLNALRKKGILTDDEVQEAWEEWKAQFDESQEDAEAGSVESEGQDADLSSTESGGSPVLHEPGSRDDPEGEGSSVAPEANLVVDERVPSASVSIDSDQ